MFSRAFGRDTLVIALGGGVTGDLAGVVAATCCRGVPLLQVPTTVLAMADSSVGGKTGIDIPEGKNLIGAFHQPDAVFMDPELLKTLSERNIRSGMVEIIKHGLIFDKDLFTQIAENLHKLLKPTENADLFNRILFQSCSIKGEIVKADETESGRRQILNFGHTIGHAVETLSEWRLLHGEAVSVGIAAACDLSSRICGFPQDQRDRVMHLLTELHTPVQWDFNIQDAVSVMLHDKKVRRRRFQFVLIRAIGQIHRTATWTCRVSEKEVMETLRAIGGA
jgi:3-dehydroquinate synthase